MTEQTPPPAKKTLTLGATLSVGGGTPSPAAPRPAGGVSVEVRRRRFDAPSNKPNNKLVVPNATTATSEEMQRRMAALQVAQSQQSTATKAREDALRQASQLQDARVQEAQARAARDAEERAVREAAALERQAQRQNLQTGTKAGSGAGGVQSGTLNQSGPSKTVDGRAFTSRSTISLEDARKRSSGGGGRPEAKDAGAKRGRNAYMSDLAESARANTGSSNNRRRRGGPREVHTEQNNVPHEKIIRDVAIPEYLTVGELAGRMAEKSADVVKKLMSMGELVTVNQTIDQATAELIVAEFGHRAVLVQPESLDDLLKEELTEATLERFTRAPIVTVMGHVDHGKTTLLDSLRKANVAKGEAGGITQHIGAYQVKAPSGRLITFLDTPGHAAFTAMRARGAQVTDVVILVVAADDGIMPQTIEAIQHARAANVPLVVALNKMDKPGVNPQKVKNELLSHDVVLEEFGGAVPCVPVSGLTGMGLPQLEEIVLLQADVLELTASPSRRATGTVVEARLDKGRGPVATVVVQDGTLRVGDIVVAGPMWGRVRALVNDRGQTVKEAGPSMPVEVLGLGGVPSAGDPLVAVLDEKLAKDVALQREQQARERSQAARKMTLEGLMEKLADTGAGVQDLNVIVKADVQGSSEAIAHALNQLNLDQQQVKVKVIASGVGVMTENDVNLASTTKALIVGFNVRADATARQVAEQAGVELRYYTIIYNLIDDIKAAMTGLLAPSMVEEVLGQAEIRQLFVFDRLKIAGCMVTSGKIVRGSKVRILRDGAVVHTGDLGTLKRNKDDVKDVASGYECGMTFTSFTDFKERDVVEAFTTKEVKRTLDDLKAAGARA